MSGSGEVRYCRALALLLALLTGCGRPEDISSLPDGAGEAAQWRTEGFAQPGKPEEEQAFWTEQYLPWEHRSQGAGTEELACVDFGVCGELFWHLGREQGDEEQYILEIYDTDNGEAAVKRFSLGELGVEAGLGVLDSMDMIDREHYVFRWADYELCSELCSGQNSAHSGEGMYRQSADRMIYTDLAGDIQAVDLRERYLEKEILQEELMETRVMSHINWRCDGKGNICVIAIKENGCFGMYLFEKNGELLLEYEGTPRQQPVDPLRTPEGELILPIYDENGKCYEFLWMDAEEGELRCLARMETSYPYIRQMYGMLGSDIYYRAQETAEDWIVRWDTQSGKRVQVFDFRATGISSNYQTMLALREGQTPVLRLIKYEEGRPRKEWLAAFAQQKPAEDGVIRVADLAAAGESKETVAACASLASMEALGFRYEYEDASASEARDRVLLELSQGQGPDLLFVPLEDMHLLGEKGLLMDMGELLPRELQEELLPGALEIGTVDGRLLGVPAAVSARTLAVAGDVWTEDTWQLEDVIGLMEEGKLTGTIRPVPHYMMGKYLTPDLTVMELLNYSLADSFLIDWENRESHFEDERFVRLLELTAEDKSAALADAESWLDGGKNIFLGYFTGEAQFLDFFAHMEAEGGRIVGYPTNGGCGSYLMADGGVLAVNANIARKEAAVCFLETMLGEELQLKSHFGCRSVRRLSPGDYIVREESGRLVFMGGTHAPEVPEFEDGATALHRAGSFLENCVAPPPSYYQINRIILEELHAMYAEGKSPQTAAEIIDSRVQLYLDEGK